MKSILVPVDFSDATPGVVETAKQMATAFGGRIVLLHVIEPVPDFVGFEAGPPAMLATAPPPSKVEHLQLENLQRTLAEAGFDVTAQQTNGVVADQILEEAAAQESGLIIMGSHGHGAFYELLVGSVTTGVLKNTRCPVVVVPARK